MMVPVLPQRVVRVRNRIQVRGTAGDAVIVLDKAAAGRQERIPLTDLNLPATEAAAQAAGLDFAPLQSSR